MNRYSKYNLLLKTILLSKFSIFKPTNLPELYSVQAEAGHFTKMHVEHGLIFINILNQVPIIKTYKHGKQLKQTATLFTTFSKNDGFNILNKLIHIFLPSLEDLLIHTRKRLKNTTTYYWTIRNFFELDSMPSLLTDRILYKKVFLPLTLKISLKSFCKIAVNESYLRMLRLPFLIR